MPPGKIKLLAFFGVFIIWVGGWGAVDQIVDLLSHGDKWTSLALYSGSAAGGMILVRHLAKRYS